jgi:hypothetical protein
MKSEWKLTYFGFLPRFFVSFVLLFFISCSFRLIHSGNTQSVCVQGISCAITVGKASCLLGIFMVEAAKSEHRQMSTVKCKNLNLCKNLFTVIIYLFSFNNIDASSKKTVDWKNKYLQLWDISLMNQQIPIASIIKYKAISQENWYFYLRTTRSNLIRRSHECQFS